MKTYYSESVTAPVPIDEASSPTTVYVNTDVQELKRDEEGKLVTYYRYLVEQYTRHEWELKQRDDVMDELITSLVDKGVIY